MFHKLVCIFFIILIPIEDNNNITNKGLKFIQNIQHLILHSNKKISDEGLKYIPNIKHLNLSVNKKAPEGAFYQ